MSTPPTSSHRRTFNLPKSSPDAGLAEWTSRIKAIQQEVDRDEEAEQRRLQDEITRSRMERARRRNTATGFTGQTKTAISPSNEKPDDMTAAMDRQWHHSETSMKLAGSTSHRLQLNASAASVSTTASYDAKPEGISLAAVIGGRATGPKLNKPAPQQDVHDPALFSQTRREGPHPIFGQTKEAIAIAERSAPVRTPSDSPVETERYVDKRVPTDLRTSELGNAAISLHENAGKVARPPEISVKPVIYHKSSSQTTSAPPEIAAKPVIYRKASDQTPGAIQNPGPSIQVRTPPGSPIQTSLHRQSQDRTSSPPERARFQRPAVPAPPKPSSLADILGSRATGPRLSKQPSREAVGEPVKAGMQGHAIPGMVGTQCPRPSRTQASTVLSPSGTTPFRPSSQQSLPNEETPSPSSSSKRSFSGSKVTIPLLARPVQPQVVIQPSLIAAASTSVSPAFLRAPPSTQELHPSLSRLQGRGFVERQVKASADISGSSNSQPGRRSSGPSGKRPSVLDRWQLPISSSSPPTSPPPDKLSNRGGDTTEAEETTAISRLISAQRVTRPPTASSPSSKHEPSMPDEAKPEVLTLHLSGAGSSASYPREQCVRLPTDEERVEDKRSVTVNKAPNRDTDKMKTTPLSHPTRDRVRKPRKGQKSSQSEFHEKPPQPETPGPEHAAGIGSVSDSSTADDTLRVESAGISGFTPPERVPSPETGRLPSPPTISNTHRKDDFPYQAPTKPIAAVISSDARPSNDINTAHTVGRRPFPTIIAPSPRPITPTSPSSSPEEEPRSPSRHSRIPSTGQRATVMDVAQALQAHEQHIRESSLTPEPDTLDVLDTIQPCVTSENIEELPQTGIKASNIGRGRNIGTAFHQTERRRSVYDRYSVITLPPLAEEKTPVPTPHGSLSRSFVHVEQSPSTEQAMCQSLQDGGSANNALKESSEKIVVENSTEILKKDATETLPESVTETPIKPGVPLTIKDAQVEEELTLKHQDKPPPGFNLQSLLKETSYSPDPHAQTISVEVISITGHIATVITREPNVFYDTEVVAVVHRAKEKTSGLVSTKVWAWRGKDAELGEREERKVLELAGRFHTKGTFCTQGSEPHELIHVLGGVLAIRQGKRVHWTVENTTMHRIHRIGDSIFVDEVDLVIYNLCSAYSYCLSVLDSLYVWHGRGSSEDERKVASAYGQSLATATMKITEFEEGMEDELFWMMLGDDGYANASHWRFRHQLERLGARLYRIDTSRPKEPVQLMSTFSSNDLPVDGVFVVDCRLELFVVVTPPARGKRIDIQLALFLAENLSAAAASKRPFDPTIHAVILPSKLPLELQAAIRLCNEIVLNKGSVPNHMNVIPLSEALDHMQRHSWPISTLSDTNFLPLGVDPRMLPV